MLTNVRERNKIQTVKDIKAVKRRVGEEIRRRESRQVGRDMEGFFEHGLGALHRLRIRTGYPADGDLLSVTIVSKDGTLADGMSTALYIMGYEKACQFWRQHREEFNVILVTDDGKIHISENLKGNFQTEWELEMIESGSE